MSKQARLLAALAIVVIGLLDPFGRFDLGAQTPDSTSRPKILAGLGAGGTQIWSDKGYGAGLLSVGVARKRVFAEFHFLDVTFLPTPATAGIPGYRFAYYYGQQVCVDPFGNRADPQSCGGPGDLDPRLAIAGELAYAIPLGRRPVAVGVGYRDGFEPGSFATVTWMSERPTLSYWYLRAAVSRRWGTGIVGRNWAFSVPKRR